MGKYPHSILLYHKLSDDLSPLSSSITPFSNRLEMVGGRLILFDHDYLIVIYSNKLGIISDNIAAHLYLLISSYVEVTE